MLFLGAARSYGHSPHPCPMTSARSMYKCRASLTVLIITIMHSKLLSLLSALAVCYQVAVAQVLANGSTMIFGTAPNGLQFQASGALSEGCSGSTNFPIFITDCYSIQLTSDPTKELDTGFRPPDTPRQRVEFLTPHAADGTSHSFQWRSYLSSQTTTTTHFFHLMQIFSTGDGGPIITVDAVSNKVAVEDNARDCSTTHCPSVALSSWTDRTIQNTLTATFGPSGRINYTMTDAHTGASIMHYAVSGAMGTGGTYLKFGTYRAAVSGMSVSIAAVGEFSGA